MRRRRRKRRRRRRWWKTCSLFLIGLYFEKSIRVPRGGE
jgi:hypothetical protein